MLNGALKSSSLNEMLSAVGKGDWSRWVSSRRPVRAMAVLPQEGYVRWEKGVSSSQLQDCPSSHCRARPGVLSSLALIIRPAEKTTLTENSLIGYLAMSFCRFSESYPSIKLHQKAISWTLPRKSSSEFDHHNHPSNSTSAIELLLETWLMGCRCLTRAHVLYNSF